MRQHLPVWIVPWHRIQNQAGVSHDSRQKVIEVVGHAARQHSNALQLLRMPQLLVHSLLFRDVTIDFQDSVWLARSIAPDRPSAGNRDSPSLFGYMLNFTLPGPRRRQLVMYFLDRLGKFRLQQLVG